MNAPELDEHTRSLAGVYSRGAGPVGQLVTALLAHIRLLDRYIDATEAQLLESSRLRTLGGPAPATTTTWTNRTSIGGQL